MRWSIRAAMLRALAALLVAVAAQPSAAYAEDPPRPDSTPTPRPEEPLLRTHDDVLVDAGKGSAGFGGFFLESIDGGRGLSYIAYVYMLDPFDQEGAERAARALMGSERFEREIRELRVLQADYSIAQLAGWYDLLQDDLWAVDGVHMSDLNEGKNRLWYGVLDESAITAAEGVLDRLGVPREAVIFEVTGPVRHDLGTREASRESGPAAGAGDSGATVAAGEPWRDSGLVTVGLLIVSGGAALAALLVLLRRALPAG